MRSRILNLILLTGLILFIQIDSVQSQCNIGNCKTCTNSQTCGVCDDGYYLDDNSCQKCYYECETCDTNYDNCLTCAQDLFLQPENGTCAEDCPDNYFKNEAQRKCIECLVDDCEECETSSICKICKQGNYLQPDQKTCQSDCPAKYFKNETSRICSTCIENCDECENSLECLNCADEYFVSNTSQCQSCFLGCKDCTDETTCEVCNIEFFLEVINGSDSCTLKCINQTDTTGIDLCIECRTEGIENDETEECLECTEGYQNKDGYCYECPDFTGSVGSGTEAVCKRCQDTNCKKCTTDPKSPANSLDLCSACGDGFYLDSKNICKQCDENCHSCSDENTCLKCKSPDFVLNGTQCAAYPCEEKEYYKFPESDSDETDILENCLPCDSNCLVCDRYNPKICKACPQNKVIDLKTQTCVDASSIQLKTCKLGAFTELDGSCTCQEEDQYYSEKDGCVQMKESNCDSCYLSGTEECMPFSFHLKCQAGCLVQKAITSKECLQCKQYVTFDEGKMLETPQYLDSKGKCQKCREGCRLCSDSFGCRECLSNYVMTRMDNGDVTCVKPKSAEKLCSDGYLPSMASIFYLNKNRPFLNSLSDRLYARGSTSLKSSSSLAFAIGVSGEPLLPGTTDERGKFYKVSSQDLKITFSYYESDTASSRTDTDHEITIECLPCLQNCGDKCAPGYYLQEETKSCHLRCPEGWLSEYQTGKCQKIQTQQPVRLKSNQIGSTGKFILRGDLNLEALIDEYFDQEFTGYVWDIQAVSSTYSSLLSAARGNLPALVQNQRHQSLPADKLFAGVVYKLDVTFKDGADTYSTSQLITPLLEAEVISFESQGFPANLIRLSSSSVAAGGQVTLAYSLSSIRTFQNSTWWFTVQADGLPTQASNYSNDKFVLTLPFLSTSTLIDLRFDVTDGIVTYRTIRQIKVLKAQNPESSLESRFGALSTNTPFTVESNYSLYPGLLKNLKKLSYQNQNQDSQIRVRVESANFLDEGTCGSLGDQATCGGAAQGACKSLGASSSRFVCECTSGFLGDFCQNKKTLTNPFIILNSAILKKIGNYLNQTTQPSVDTYSQFLFYKNLLFDAVDFLDDASVLSYSFILSRIQALAKTVDDFSVVTYLYKRVYNYYQNHQEAFQALEDKTVNTQIQLILYSIMRVSIIQNANQNLNFKNKQLALNLGSLFTGDVTYKDTFSEIRNEGKFTKNFVGAAVDYAYEMLEEAQIVGMFTGEVDRSLFKNVPGENMTISSLFKITAVDLTSNRPEEIKKTNITDGVSLVFSNLAELPENTKRACVFYNDLESKFYLDVQGLHGCTYHPVNTTEGAIDNSKAKCVCNHNTAFGIAEYVERRPRTVQGSASILLSSLSVIISIIFFIII